MAASDNAFLTNNGTITVISPVGAGTFTNRGFINARIQSNSNASAGNNYLPCASEVVVHSMLQAGEAPPEFSNLEIRNYATTLRDFGAARDLIQARWANIEFSSTNLILRPESNYSVGTSYEISADTPVNVSDLDAMTYSAEMSDFVSTDVRKISGGKNVVIFDSCVYFSKYENIIFHGHAYSLSNVEPTTCFGAEITVRGAS